MSTSNTLQLDRVKSPQELRELESIDVYVAEIIPKRASAFIKFVSEHFPSINHLDFLKRIKKTECIVDEKKSFYLEAIICIVENRSLENITTFFNNSEFDNLKISVAKVPKFPPITKEQFLSWRKLWPVSFHENKALCVDFTSAEIDYIAKFFAFIKNLSLASSNQHINKNTLQNDNSVKFIRCNCAHVVISDPKSFKKVCCATHDNHSLSTNPLNHAIMNSLEIVANSILAQSSIVSETITFSNNPQTTESLNEQASLDTLRKKRVYSDLSSASDISIEPVISENVDILDSSLNHSAPSIDLELSQSQTVNHTFDSLKPNDILQNANDLDHATNYLCTGLDVFTLKEPCTMYV
ncbi:hypothetical protein BB561_004588 [Smittium simulii]|uniref:Uncharacterized protein n=1 Tax=Smittium simulii TaxID=133385 RepID=A0A2T9YF91_9FUNG|nr:hypothetical protein BB561_004588 [Smittium simulii]